MELADYVNSAVTNPLATTATILVGLGVASATHYLMALFKRPTKTILPIKSCDQSDTVPNEEYAKKSKLFKTSSDQDCMRYLFDDCRTLVDVLPRGKLVSDNGPCLGRLNKETKEYEWLSFEETLERIKHFGSGLVQLGLSNGTDTKLGIYATNCVEYVIAEFGAYNQSMTVVPLYDTLGPNACSFIVNQAGIELVVVDTENRFEALLSQANVLTTLKHIIVTQPLIESFRSKARGFGINVHSIEEIETLGREGPKPVQRPRPADLAVICYTSGTTGNPKGAMLTHENIIANLSSVVYQLGDHKPTPRDIYMSFLPLAHMFERCCAAAMFMTGTPIGFFSGDIRNLSDDMKILRPTMIPCVPRLFNRIMDKVFTQVKGNRLKEWLLNKALAAKEAEVAAGIIRNNGFWDMLVFKSVRAGMGGRLRLIVVGSAPLCPKVMAFMRCALGCLICEGYGQTESVCPATLTIPGDPDPGHVGPPLASCYVKLVDVPEMEYYARDGSGEVCIKGPIVFQGYYSDQDKTSEAIDNEGWLHTGDIGTWLENGTLRIVDRKKHIFKLSQGEYIAPEKIESIYSRSQFVAQIFVYGESIKSCLVAIVVPINDVLYKWARDKNIKGTIRDLCDDPRVKQAVLDDLCSLGKKEGLKAFEQVKDIALCPEQFSIDNGLLTPTLKTKRPECRKFFVKEIQEMYRCLD